jgi:Raf kinase inhibitor-like YbhB/YbcL family protein
VRRVVLLTSSLLLVTVVASCRHDGRTLRPARADQNATISSPGAPTTAFPSFDQATDPPVSDGGGTLPGTTTGPLFLTAPWPDGGKIDPYNTCDGADVAPALSWSPAPAGTVEVALTLVDDDAPSFAHWTLAGLSPDLTSIGEGEVPAGAFQGTNGAGGVGYTGPCPPAGTTHTYRFTVHYLDQQLELGDGAVGGDLLLAIDGATFESVEVAGTYSRP